MHYKDRIPPFITAARDIASLATAKVLADQELEWIYANHPASNMPKKIISEYRKALGKAGLGWPWLDRTVQVVEDGIVIDPARKEKGFFRERSDAVAARRKADDKRHDDQLMTADDVRLLMDHEASYLTMTQRLCNSPDWEQAAVGVLMATGRRTIEVGRTATMHPWRDAYWVNYAGQAKTRSADRAAAWHPQPVLVPASLVCHALQTVQTAVAREMDSIADEDFDRVIGRRIRHAVANTLQMLFPHASTLSPRTLRNCFVALALEAVTPDNVPLRKDHEDPDTFLKRILGHADNHFLPHDAYKRQILPRLRRHIVLPA